MNEKDLRDNRIRTAIDECLSGVEKMPNLQYKVLLKTRGEIKVKKKLSVGVIIALVLLAMSVTALAVAYLSTQEMVEQKILPMAKQNDQEPSNDHFSNEELAHIVDMARDNGISLSNDILTALEGGQGYWEQEVIMELAKNDFGPIFSQWTLEEQHWFGEVMVSLGFRDTNPSCLPGAGEISYEQAMAVCIEKILQTYGDDVIDAAIWRKNVTYEVGMNEESEISAPSWFFWFQPVDTKHNEYMLAMESNGEITSLEVYNALSDKSSDTEVLSRYHAAYGGFWEWSPEIWVAFGADMRGLPPSSSTTWALQNTQYILPPADGLSLEQAKDVALSAVDLDYTSVFSAVCCMNGEMPIWKVETHTNEPRDIGSGKHTAVWIVEINCITGEVCEKREFIVGSDMDPLTRWIPWSVYENLPPMPAEPNG